MPKNSINSLIEKTSHKDNGAFEVLYKEMRKPVYYYALHFCGNHAIAEDVMQDTFITIWSKSTSFIPQGNGRSWILSIAKNKTLDIMKKANRSCSLDDIGDMCVEDNRINSFENKTMLDGLFQILNRKELDVVILRHIVGLSLTEISKEKNMKKGTVFWTYNTAIKKLRNAYERMKYDEK